MHCAHFTIHRGNCANVPKLDFLYKKTKQKYTDTKKSSQNLTFLFTLNHVNDNKSVHLIKTHSLSEKVMRRNTNQEYRLFKKKREKNWKTYKHTIIKVQFECLKYGRGTSKVLPQKWLSAKQFMWKYQVWNKKCACTSTQNNLAFYIIFSTGLRVIEKARFLPDRFLKEKGGGGDYR